MQSCDFENFDITIRGEAAPFAVSARFQEQTADGTFQHEIGLPFWQHALHQMRRTLYTPSPYPMRAAGTALFNDLFRGDIRDLWIAARAGMERKSLAGLRLRLALQPPTVAALPWETLYDPARGTVFAISNRIQLVRVEQEYRRLSAPVVPHIELPLRILVAAPDDPAKAIDTHAEIQIVKRMLATFGNDQIKINIMTGRFSILDLRRRLTKHRSHILHILSHGVSDGIQMWQNGRPRMVPATSIQTTLERTPSVRFVFLNACLTGQSSGTEPMSALGPQLLRAGIPAVLAMQFEIRDDVATEFAHFLYEALLTGTCPGAIDSAVTDARSSLYALNPHELGFVTPVLWLNAVDGRIVTFDSVHTEPGEQDDGAEEAPQDETPDDSDSETGNREGSGENDSDGTRKEGDDTDSSNGNDNGKGDGDSPAPPGVADHVDIHAETIWLTELAAEVKTIRVKPELAFALTALTQTLETLYKLLERLRNWNPAGRVQAYEEQALLYRRKKAEALRLRRKLREAM